MGTLVDVPRAGPYDDATAAGYGVYEAIGTSDVSVAPPTSHTATDTDGRTPYSFEIPYPAHTTEAGYKVAGDKPAPMSAPTHKAVSLT